MYIPCGCLIKSVCMQVSMNACVCEGMQLSFVFYLPFLRAVFIYSLHRLERKIKRKKDKVSLEKSIPRDLSWFWNLSFIMDTSTKIKFPCCSKVFLERALLLQKKDQIFRFRNKISRKVSRGTRALTRHQVKKEEKKKEKENEQHKK